MRKVNDGKFFQTTKRGEIQELKDELHTNDKAKQKDAVKKVIANMTVGKDVSALFADVVNCIQTDNIELKKLVYLYVMNYAKAQPELAILAINTFRKDASDPNPLIRSLAVRTMGCIRLDQVTEYLLEPLRKCCQDPDPYVRKTSAICIPKVYDINPELVEDQGFIDILKELLSDSNPMVVANAVAGLAEIAEVCGKDLIDLDNKATIPKLLAALNECNEWGQVFILDALATYSPSSGNDAESITERVTARLSHANPAVVLAAIKVVLKSMDFIDNGETARNLAKKLNPPLVTLLSSEPEIQYVALRNIRLIVQKRPGILSQDVKMFFCKYNDPVYVKLEKVDIMVMLVSERNVEQVLLELKEYSSGVDVDFVRKSVRSIGRVAVKLEKACDRAITVLLELIETKVNYVVQEATVVIKDVFRKYPTRYEQVLAALCDSLEALDEPEAKASMIWILGEYAERIDNVDELLDAFLQSFHDEPPIVQQQLLTAIVKLFLKKPVTTQNMVSAALRCATEESNNHDLRDRGYIYWRLLSTNPEATKHVVLGDKPTIRDESQNLEKGVLEKLIADLSLMSSVYHKPRDEFITRVSAAAQPEENEVQEDEDINEDDRAENRRRQKEEMEGGGDSRNGGEDRSPAGGGAAMDLLDLDGGDDLLGGPATPAVQKQLVLPPTQAGQGGKTGFSIASALARQGGEIKLLLTLTNNSQGPMGGFAVQINKNPFGIGPTVALACPDLAHGQSNEVSLAMAANTPNLMSGTAPANPLFLQIAIKNSLDIFYFNVPFELPAVLLENGGVAKDLFTQVWQRVGETKQHVITGSVAQSLTPDGIRNSLAVDNITYVAQRQKDDDTTFVYVSATTSNQIVLLAEVTISRRNTFEIKTRTETPAIIGLFEAALCKRLGVKQ
jgi:AP-1 complex subunit beta-1